MYMDIYLQGQMIKNVLELLPHRGRIVQSQLICRSAFTLIFKFILDACAIAKMSYLLKI